MVENSSTPRTLVDEPLVRIESLTVAFPNERGDRLVPVVRDVSLTIARNEIVGLVGESGSGKTQTSLAILGLTRPPGRVTSGRIMIDGQDVVTMNEEWLRTIRGRKAAMIFQSPRTSLNPLMNVGDQIARVYVRHQNMNKEAAARETLVMLRKVGIAGPERVASSYPHQLSGGMAQRVMIGMMMACGPELLIADEPTTGLDVTIQAQIFELITEVQAETRMSVLLITHDLGVVAETCHRVAVMQQGRLVEIGPVGEIFARPVHPYTQRLLDSMLRPDRPPGELVPVGIAPESNRCAINESDYVAVSVDAWPRLGVARAEMIELRPGHSVLAHQLAPTMKVPA
jgi:peptide/nickel transport system ATP-binding protein